MKRLFISIWIAVLIVAIVADVSAQQAITVKGTVTDAANRETLPGVSVIVKGTTTGTQTGANGDFTISAPANATLVFTYIGFQRREVPVNNQTTLNVQLQASAQQLEQVVVVGYGAQRRRDVTGAVSNVQGSELARQPVQTATQAVQGRVAGVQVIASGQPNSQPQVRIRGTGSTLAGVNPLYVVDGVLTDDIRNINTADIQSMDVLKDASAAIYGVRAANGVIIITTKKGRSGKMEVSYNATAGVRQAVNVVKMANSQQYIDYIRVAAPDRYNSLDADRQSGLIYSDNRTTDWYDPVLRNALQMNHNISVSGGSDKNTFYYSAGIITENGIVRTNDFNRFTFRANNDINISTRLKLTSQLSFSRSKDNPVDAGSVFNSSYRASPLVPGKVGNLYGNTSSYGNVGNPLVTLDKRDQELMNNRFLGNLALEYNPFKFLKFRTAFNADLIYGNDRTYTYQYLNDASTFSPPGGSQQQQNSNLSVRKDNAQHWVWDNTVTWDQTFNSHHFTVLAGTVTENYTSNFMSGSRINVPPSEDQWYLSLGDPERQSLLDNGGDKYTRQSFVGRVNYEYVNKYLLSASLRADGSSRFSERWGYFPTVGVGWVISEEDFLKDQKVFNFLKLRANWGRLGNDNIPSNLYTTLARINVPYFYNSGLTLGSVIEDIKDIGLRWETTDQYDIGLEFAFLNNRLSGEIDYYNKKTNDALGNVLIPAIFGDPNNMFVTNIASFRNSGFEFGLNWKDKLNDDFNYRIGGNISFNRNKVIGLNGGQALRAGDIGNGNLVTYTNNGYEVGTYYVYNAMGVFRDQAEIDAYVGPYGTRIQPDARPGDFKFADTNGNGTIDENDRIYADSYQPSFFYGINMGAGWKNFDLSADFYGNAGNKIYNGRRNARTDPRNNIEASYADNRWTADRPSSTDPAIINQSTRPSTYFIESGSFLRLNNLTIGYTLPEAVMKRSFISSLRIFLTAQNLFTIKKYSGFSPEVQPVTGANPLENISNTDVGSGGSPLNAGVDLNTYPTTRTISFGVNLGF